MIESNDREILGADLLGVDALGAGPSQGGTFSGWDLLGAGPSQGGTLSMANPQPFKGQLISNGVLMSLISSKKRRKEFDFTTMIPQIDLFSFVFWTKSKTPKNHFEII